MNLNLDWMVRDSEPRAWGRAPRHYRRRRLRMVLVLLALGVAVLAMTSRCGAPGRAAGAGVGEAPPSCSEALTEDVSLPTDAFRRCATKALRGDYGELAEWQRKGYQRGLCNGAQKTRCWVTTFFPAEGNHRGDTTASGWGCSERVASANLLPMWTWVWTPQTGIRQVMDRGARSNDAVAQRRYGAELWIDFWEPREGSLFGDENGGARSVWIIRRDER